MAVRYDSRADWRGEKAKPPISATNGMTSAREKMRTAKMLRMSCMPLRMRWPSRKAAGSTPNESLMSTRSATPRAAGLPLCMAMPRSARLSAITSFTPSPTMAT